MGIIVFGCIQVADAKSMTGSFYQLNHEVKQVDPGAAEIQFEFTNTATNPINNVILEFSVKDAKSGSPKTGFVFVGQTEPNIPVKGRIPLDASSKTAEYRLSIRVLQNADFQLKKDSVYPLTYFNSLVEIVETPLIMRSGVAVWSGTITNKSAIPLRLVHFYVDYVDMDGNVMKTLLQKWGNLNVGETKSYTFSNLIPKEFKRSEISIVPIEPGYESGK